MMIGIVDESKQRNQRSSFKSGNAICYQIDGKKHPGEIPEGYGFG
jgi:hypothetical protein